MTKKISLARLSGHRERQKLMDVFERLARPKPRGKLLNSSFSNAKPDPYAKAKRLRQLLDEEDEDEFEETRHGRVAAQTRRGLAKGR